MEQKLKNVLACNEFSVYVLVWNCSKKKKKEKKTPLFITKSDNIERKPAKV